MTSRVLIIGGYGNFGTFISRSLAHEKDLQLIIAGRSADRATAFAKQLGAEPPAKGVALDINQDLTGALAVIEPDIVIHTSGPFQSQNHFVAEACVQQGCHYIDLADGREFVAGISELDHQAKDKGILVISGGSSVPCLTSAIVDHYKPEFGKIEALDYGITTAQKTTPGPATTAAILSYTGRPFTTLIDGDMRDIFGWQGLRARKYPGAGWRLLGNCNVPDLTLFPKRYPDLKTVRFYAGLEIPLIHIALWGMSWLVRCRVIRNLEKAAKALLSISYLFDWLGSSTSAFHMKINGTDKAGLAKTVTFELTACSGDGPYIPCMPAILMAKKLARHEITVTGAYPCMGFITLDEYLGALKDLDIGWKISRGTGEGPK